MLGPSSSHTAAPVRIGNIASQLMPGRLKEAVISFPAEGSFAKTYKGHRSDIGFAGGLLGYDTDNREILNALNQLKSENVRVLFKLVNKQADHPNTVYIDLENTSGQKVFLTALSLGGGMIEIVEVNNFELSLRGDYYELLIFLDKEHSVTERNLANFDELIAAKNRAVECRHVSAIKNNDGNSGNEVEKAAYLVNYKLFDNLPEDLLSEIAGLDHVTSVKLVAPVLPVFGNHSFRPPFSSAVDLVKVLNGKDIGISDAAIIYETTRSGWSKNHVIKEIDNVIEVMEQAVQEGLNQKKAGKIIASQSHLIKRAENAGKLVPVGCANNALAFSMAVVEVNVTSGIVVAAPTAGSSGVLPGALLGVAADNGFDLSVIRQGMLAAGCIGLLIAKGATFAAEVCGCQAECGAAASMAAAGIVQLYGGSGEQSLAGASIALQNVLGLICDPVAEQAEVPCLGKNVLASVNAIASANMALAGVDPVIPLDEVIQAMYNVGNALPQELRCTGLGGLAATPTAQKIKRTINDE